MATLTDNLTRLRRFLRDPDGLVWSDADILAQWNEAQLEICQKCKGLIERVEAHHYPPQWTWSYFFEWEEQHLEGDMHQALIPYTQAEHTMSYPWEAGYWVDLSDTPDSGYRFTIPWEGALVSTPADIVPLKLHTRLQRMKFAAYDEEPISELQPREVARDDNYWMTRTGQVRHYVPYDETRNLFFLYPHPSGPVWDTEMTEDVPFDDTGGLLFDLGSLYESDTGLTTDSIDTEDSVFMIYDAIPYEQNEWYEDNEIPAVFLKYIEYGTLERCFGADNDGFIPSLRDYWQMRKEAGVQAIQRMLRMRVKDRDYCLGRGSTAAVRRRGGSLGPHYPSV